MRGSIHTSSHYRPIRSQKVSYTGTAGTIGNAVGSQIYVVRVVVDSAAYIAFGQNPTATTSDMFLPANTPEYFTISPGEKVSAVQDSGGGDLYVTEMSQ